MVTVGTDVGNQPTSLSYLCTSLRDQSHAVAAKHPKMAVGLGVSLPPPYGACMHGLPHEPPPYTRLFGHGPPSYANALEFEIGLLPSPGPNGAWGLRRLSMCDDCSEEAVKRQ